MAYRSFRLAMNQDIKTKSFLNSNHQGNLLVNLCLVLFFGDTAALVLIPQRTNLLGLRERPNSGGGEDGKARKLLFDPVFKFLLAAEIGFGEGGDAIGNGRIGSKGAGVLVPLRCGVR